MLEIVLYEGRNTEIRKMCEQLGLESGQAEAHRHRTCTARMIKQEALIKRLRKKRRSQPAGGIPKEEE